MRSQWASERRRQWLLAVVVAGWFAVVLWNGLLGALSLLPLGVYLVRPRGSVRDHMIAWLRRAQRKQAERRRRRRLRSAGALRQYQYAELRRLAVHVHGRARCEIEELLERFVTLSIAHEHLVDALARAIATDVRILGDVTGALADDPQMCVRVRDIRSRRRQHRRSMRERADHMADDLEALVDLVQLLVARALLPVGDALELQHEVDRRLSLLDDSEAAMAMLSSAAILQNAASPSVRTETA